MSRTPNGSQKGQGTSPGPQYTLPGVINYLTSEFTNLERYKILNSLEKSEMKHKINELQGELNSLRYIEERQRHQIYLLQQENQLLKSKLTSNDDDKLANMSASMVPDLPKLPEIDLSLVKSSREQLNKAMNEVLYLLKTPSPNVYNYLNLQDPTIETQEEGMNKVDTNINEYNELLSNNTDNPLNNKPSMDLRSNSNQQEFGFSKFLNDKNGNMDLSKIDSINKNFESLSHGIGGSNSNSKDVTDELFGEVSRMESKSSSNDRIQDINEINSYPASDSETVTYDEDEFAFNGDGNGIQISTKNENYPNVLVFDGDDELIPFINYAQDNNVQISFHSIITNEILITGKLNLINHPNEILNVVHLFQDSNIHQVLIVYKNGCFQAVSIDKTTNAVQSRILPQFEQVQDGKDSNNMKNSDANNEIKMNSVVITKFNNECTPFKNCHGLSFALNGYLYIFEIIADHSSVTVEKLGQWSQQSVNISDGGLDLNDFEAVGWYVNDKTNLKTSTIVNIDRSLGSYALLIQNSGNLIKFNLVNQVPELISKSYSKEGTNKEALKLRFQGNWCATTTKDNVIQVLDLSNYNRVSAQISCKQFIILEKKNTCQLVTETRGRIAFYDSGLKRTKEMKKNGDFRKVGGNLMIVSDTTIEIIE